MEDHAADQLHVEMAHVEDAPAGFAHHGEGLDQEVVERGALGEFFFEFNGFGGEVDVGELAHCGLEVVDRGHGGQHLFDFALVFGAENFRQNGIKSCRSRNGRYRKYYFTLLKMTGAGEAR